MADSKIKSGKAVIVLKYTKTVVFHVRADDFKSFVLKTFVRFKNDAYLKAIPSLHGGLNKITLTVPLNNVTKIHRLIAERNLVKL